MEFGATRPARRPREAVVPMINVVFLLLVFFLLTAVLAPAPPFPLALPESGAGAERPGAEALHVGADGTLAFGALRGGEALAAAVEAGRGAGLELRADGALPAAELARLLARLAEAGVADATLVTVRP